MSDAACVLYVRVWLCALFIDTSVMLPQGYFEVWCILVITRLRNVHTLLYLEQILIDNLMKHSWNSVQRLCCCYFIIQHNKPTGLSLRLFWSHSPFSTSPSLHLPYLPVIDLNRSSFCSSFSSSSCRPLSLFLSPNTLLKCLSFTDAIK